MQKVSPSRRNALLRAVCYPSPMLKPRPSSHNKRIRESSLLQDFSFLSNLPMLKAKRGEAGVKYIIYDGSLKIYYIAFVDYDGVGKLLARHNEERVEDLDNLLNLYGADSP